MKRHLEIWWDFEKSVFVFFPTFAYGECMPEVKNSYWLAFLWGPWRLGLRLCDNNITLTDKAAEM